MRLWDARTGRVAAVLDAHASVVYGVAFSPNGQVLASGSTDNTIRLWDAHTGQQIGETLSGTTGALNSTTAGDYTPVGILDGLGAYSLDADTVRVFANHELLNFRGYTYSVSDGGAGSFTMEGGRISYFDIDKASRHVVDSGLAYDTVYDANGAMWAARVWWMLRWAGFDRAAILDGGLKAWKDSGESVTTTPAPRIAMADSAVSAVSKPRLRSALVTAPSAISTQIHQILMYWRSSKSTGDSADPSIPPVCPLIVAAGDRGR